SYNDGRMAVVDRGTDAVMLYDTAGRHVMTLGGYGRGPGEYVDDPFISLLEPDTIVAWDQVARRLSWFTTDGQLVGAAQLAGVIPSGIPIAAGGIQWELKGKTLLSTACRNGAVNDGARSTFVIPT